MKFEDCYPPEIVEWAQALPKPDYCTPQQMRINKVLEDAEVIRCAAKLFDDANNSDIREAALQLIDNFQGLIEDASALPDENPPGTALRTDDNQLVFLTPTKIRQALTQTAAQALKLGELISQTAPTLAEDEQHLEYLKQMIAQLESLHDLCIQKANKHASKTFGEKDFPIGSTAGINERRNWLLQRLTGMAEVRLSNRDNDLILAIHRALVDLDEQMNDRTAAEVTGKPSSLDPEYANHHANTFNAWALNNKYPLKPNS